ncbi:MAG: hypothetical protein BroJett002_37060 [Candidatus Brocadia sinica]|nr:MAG: hypothetical protein BroJett002_37060 [Candidatus Brocadia sinica]
MNEVNKITGNGINITLDGKDYILSPLTINDIGEIEIFAKAERIKALLLVNPGLSIKEQINIMKTPLTPEEIEGVTNSIHGAIYYIWLSMKHAQPDITLDEVKKLVSRDNLRDILNLVDSFATPKNETAQTPIQAEKP